MFLDIKREYQIRKTLRKLSKQRVALVLQPGAVWVVEKALEDTEETDAMLKTCFIRGWVEPLENAVPKGKFNPDDTFPDGEIFHKVGTVWKLTDSGWASINRAHQWTMLGVFAGIIGIIVALRPF